MKKILVMGSSGMLGHVVYKYFNELGKYDLVNSALHNHLNSETLFLNVLDRPEVERQLENVNPDVVINCIGLLIAKSAENVEEAIQINSLLPHLLARLGQELDYKLIQISTDCVFSGLRGSYSESDFRDADTLYARTKSLGEVFDDRNLTIRTSIVGPELKKEGSGLFHWFFNQEGPIDGYKNVFWTGVTTLELAKAIDEFIIQDISGIFHFCPRKKISKYDLLKLFQKIWNKNNVEINPLTSIISDKSLISNRNDFDFEIKDYFSMLSELRSWMIKYENLYSNYLND